MGRRVLLARRAYEVPTRVGRRAGSAYRRFSLTGALMPDRAAARASESVLLNRTRSPTDVYKAARKGSGYRFSGLREGGSCHTLWFRRRMARGVSVRMKTATTR